MEVACFKVLHQHFPMKTKKQHEVSISKRMEKIFNGLSPAHLKMSLHRGTVQTPNVKEHTRQNTNCDQKL
jgi:hypothetical protein